MPRNSFTTRRHTTLSPPDDILPHVGLREEADPHRGAVTGDGARSLGLSAGRAPPARAACCHRPDRSEPAQTADRSADDALDLPVFRGREPGRVPAPGWTAPARSGWSGAPARAGGRTPGSAVRKTLQSR